MPDAFEWKTTPTEDCGFSSPRLEILWEDLQARQTKALLIARGDHIICERYAADWSADRRHYTASLTKAIVGGLSLMVAMDDGLICPDDPACRYVPQWRDDPLRSRITIRHLATHTSGVENAELSDADREAAARQGKTVTDDHMALPGWKGAFWRQEPDPFTLARDSAPIIFEPGSRYDYSNPGMAMLAYAVTGALRGSPWPDIRTLLRQRVFEPIGLRDEDWSIGYDQTFEVDGLPLVGNWGGGSFTARAMARIGRLIVHQGAWNGQQIIGPAIVREAVSYAGMPVPEREDGNPASGSGLCWWLNFDGIWAGTPRDAFAGVGAGDQILLAVPSLDLVVVRNGGNLNPETPDWSGWRPRVEHLIDAACACIQKQPPYPRSEVLQHLDWDSPSQVRRLARGGRRKDGSDNWPMTWADDDHLYTAYGDGYGFEPQIDGKLSLGLGLLVGDPDDFVALNIRSRTGEFVGQGREGEKASGLLMIGGVLYMWVRNADHEGRTARLGWSTDHARTWSWADWTLDELGHPTFVNFGRNYAGARDEYAYIVSHDDPSAYVCADRFILIRVPADQLRQRDAYEFFVGLDDRGGPVWSSEIGVRGAVFTHAGQCRRSSVSYNAGLGRYLWWQQLTSHDTDTRFDGGFGVYDAPEPWGPWTTAFFTDTWDMGPGDLGCFPTRWMSPDGRLVYMVFSSEDNLAVRRARVTVRG